MLQILTELRLEYRRDASTLAGMLASSNQTRRILDALARIGDPDVAGAVVPHVQDVDKDTRIAAVLALGQMADSPTAREGLADALQSSDSAVRIWSVRGLARSASRVPTEWFLDALRDRHWVVRHVAVRALGAHADARAIPRIASLLTDDNELVRAEAIKTIAQIGGESAAELLEHHRARGGAETAALRSAKRTLRIR